MVYREREKRDDVFAVARADLGEIGEEDAGGLCLFVYLFIYLFIYVCMYVCILFYFILFYFGESREFCYYY